MKKLLLGAAFAAMGCAVALAQNGAKPYAHQSAAVQASETATVTATDLSAAKKKKRKKMGGSLKGNAVGPETGTAKDKASAPAR